MHVMQVNNEVGSVQPLQEVIRMRDERCPDAFLHVDGVQASCAYLSACALASTAMPVCAQGME